LSPLAKTLKKLHVELPSIDTGNLIPNALSAVKTSVKEATTQIDRYLKMKVKKHEGLTTLMIELEGTLDRFNVAEVKKRILKAANKAKMDIVINFEHLKYAAPEAISALLDWRPLKHLAPKVRVKVMNLKNSFRETVDHIALRGREISKEDLSKPNYA
jgi:adenylate kinase family enzyme